LEKRKILNKILKTFFYHSVKFSVLGKCIQIHSPNIL
uniref:Ovule protein n=1 Tax=Strongyloides venezuelensis TaxID=75913 RepID=A0A0K0ETX9_STRVS